MEEVNNLTLEDVLDVVQGFPIIPRRNRLIITVNVEEADDELVLTNSTFAESQYVVASRDNLTDIKAGDKVLIDIEKMMVSEKVDENSHERIGMLKLKPIKVNDIVYAIISDAVVLAIDKRV